MEPLDELIAALAASPKYGAISPELLRAVAARALAAQRSPKLALKEAKSRLHQVAGAFLDRAPRYAAWLAALRAAAGDQAQLREACRAIMAGHASTRERLPAIERFYAEVFAGLPPPAVVADLACGLNPLAAPWMGLPEGATYLACDLYADMCDFLGAALPLLGLRGEAAVCDLTAGPPSWRADVALILKTLPVLEHVRRGAGRELLRALDAPLLVVSYPTRSLGGRNVGMAATYGAQMRAICAEEGWGQRELELPGELVFLVRK